MVNSILAQNTLHERWDTITGNTDLCGVLPRRAGQGFARGAGGPGSKHQASSFRETPNSKFQAPSSKPDVPIRPGALLDTSPQSRFDKSVRCPLMKKLQTSSFKTQGSFKTPIPNETSTMINKLFAVFSFVLLMASAGNAESTNRLLFPAAEFTIAPLDAPPGESIQQPLMM